MTKVYDRSYFDRWYRRERVHARGELQRRVAMVVGVTEFLLQRPLRRVLDVGCGEGRWQTELKKIRPSADYLGVDSSEYAVERYGRTRNIRLGSVGSVGDMGIPGGFDLVVCSDVLHYLPPKEIDAGVQAMSDLGDGVIYLAVFTKEDDPAGDLTGWQSRPASWYRRRFQKAGLTHLGMQCYASPALSGAPSSLEWGVD